MKTVSTTITKTISHSFLPSNISLGHFLTLSFTKKQRIYNVNITRFFTTVSSKTTTNTVTTNNNTDVSSTLTLKRRKTFTPVTASEQDAIKTWRKVPGKSNNWMADENLPEAYNNLLFLADYKEHPPKAIALERVLRHVQTADDLAVAIKALNVCRTRGTYFDGRTAQYFTQACLRAGNAEAALEQFRDPARSRLFVTSGVLKSLVLDATNRADSKLLTSILSIVHAKKLGLYLRTYDVAWRVTAAHAKCGNIETALNAYKQLNSSFTKDVGRHPVPTGIILDALKIALEKKVTIPLSLDDVVKDVLVNGSKFRVLETLAKDVGKLHHDLRNEVTNVEEKVPSENETKTETTSTSTDSSTITPPEKSS